MDMKGDYKNDLGNKAAKGEMPRMKKYGGGSMKRASYGHGGNGNKRMKYSKGGDAMPKAEPC